MGLVTIRTATCDYKNCKNNAGQNGPSVVSFDLTLAQQGQISPEVAKFITLEMGGGTLAFCSQLHAAQFFLPVAYEVVPKKIIEFPKLENPETGPEVTA